MKLYSYSISMIQKSGPWLYALQLLYPTLNMDMYSLGCHYQVPSTAPTLLCHQPTVIRDHWSHHSKPHTVTVSERTQALKMVKAFGISPYILNTSLHVHTIVGTKTSLGIGGFLVAPQALSIYSKTF